MDNAALLKLFKEGEAVNIENAVRVLYDTGYHDGIESTKDPKPKHPTPPPVTSTSTATHTATGTVAHPGATAGKK